MEACPRRNWICSNSRSDHLPRSSLERVVGNSSLYPLFAHATLALAPSGKPSRGREVSARNAGNAKPEPNSLLRYAHLFQGSTTSPIARRKRERIDYRESPPLGRRRERRGHPTGEAALFHPRYIKRFHICAIQKHWPVITGKPTASTVTPLPRSSTFRFAASPVRRSFWGGECLLCRRGVSARIKGGRDERQRRNG
jgi:hypothetical protein